MFQIRKLLLSRSRSELREEKGLMRAHGCVGDEGWSGLGCPGACKYASFQLILKALWRGGQYFWEFADEGTEGQSGWLAQSHTAGL